MLGHIIACGIIMWGFRVGIIIFTPQIHSKKSNYWNFSAAVGVIGILGFLYMDGIYVNENYNIGTAIGFFWPDLYRGGLGPYMNPFKWLDWFSERPKKKIHKINASKVKWSKSNEYDSSNVSRTKHVFRGKKRTVSRSSNGRRSYTKQSS